MASILFHLFFGLIIIYKKFLKKGTYIILLLLVVQIVDISPGLSRYLVSEAYNKEKKELQNKFWEEIKSKI